LTIPDSVPPASSRGRHRNHGKLPWRHHRLRQPSARCRRILRSRLTPSVRSRKVGPKADCSGRL
jgi:hypothetical protein